MCSFANYFSVKASEAASKARQRSEVAGKPYVVNEFLDRKRVAAANKAKGQANIHGNIHGNLVTNSCPYEKVYDAPRGTLWYQIEISHFVSLFNLFFSAVPWVPKSVK